MIKAMILGAGVIFLSALSGLAAGENGLKNASFEMDQNHDGKADYWFTHPGVMEAAEGSTIVWSDRAGDAALGKGYLRLSKTGGKLLTVTQELDAAGVTALRQTPDVTVLLRGKIRGNDLDAKGARLAVQVFARPKPDGKNHYVNRLGTKPVTGSTEWREVEVSFRLSDIIPAGEEVNRLEINLELLSNSGSADFDDLSLSFQP